MVMCAPCIDERMQRNGCNGRRTFNDAESLNVIVQIADKQDCTFMASVVEILKAANVLVILDGMTLLHLLETSKLI